MIITKLSGGLGNQMFQYAAGRALALRRNTDLALDLSWYKKPHRSTTGQDYWQPYQLGAFQIQTVAATEKPASTLPDQGFAFAPHVLDAPDGTLLAGFWQSERYFADFEQEIRGDFQFADDPTPPIAAMIDRLASEESVSVHVRRGSAADYRGDPAHWAFADFGLLDAAYYEAAMQHVAERVPGARFYVFTDDPAWCFGNLPGVLVMPDNPGLDDLRLMSACRHHVVANSSFSWWGAWLDPNADKIVVGPVEFAEDRQYDSPDYLPESWVKVPAGR